MPSSQSSHQDSPRYAIYFVPHPESLLMQKASRWLGRDIFTNRSMDFPENLAISADCIEKITKSPRHYGFHATLKAPFRLADGKDEKALREIFTTFFEAQKPFIIPALTYWKIGSFYAFICTKTSVKLDELAHQTVQQFEPFRAPLDDFEIQKRNPQNLSEKQRLYLMDWGYPYIFEEFRFHLTLTDKMEARRNLLEEALETWFSDALQNPLEASVALAFQENRQSPFQVLDFKKLGNSGN